MFISEEQKGGLGSFKLGYSRGLPSYLAPKLLVHKKQEEFFIANLFAQSLTYLQVPVIGVNATIDDSNKGADAVIKIADGKEITIQVTRFTLTDYLNRRKVAEKKVEKLIAWIKEKTSIDFPVNITIPTYKYKTIPANSQKLDIQLAHFIASLLENNKEKLRQSPSSIMVFLQSYIAVLDRKVSIVSGAKVSSQVFKPYQYDQPHTIFAS